MAKDIFDLTYEKHKARKIKYFFTELLCEIILLRYEFVYDNISKKDVLNELPGLRTLTTKEVETIYKNAKTLLKVKYNIVVIQDNPFIFQDNRK